MKKIFVIQPFTPESSLIYSIIGDVAAALGASIMRADTYSTDESIMEDIYQAIKTADLLVCDVTGRNPNVMYELGYAHALRRPTILIVKRPDFIPFSIRSKRNLVYDPDTPRHLTEFKNQLQEITKIALEQPDMFRDRPEAEIGTKSVFISYSHKDTEFLNRLLIHLQPLAENGLIDFWADTKIKAGDNWRDEIEKALKRARIAILLISADFLASEFITKNELPPLLGKAEVEGTRIIPVIVKPCRFSRDKNLSKFQAINSPSSPLILLSEGDRENIYDQVSEAVENLTIE